MALYAYPIVGTSRLSRVVTRPVELNYMVYKIIYAFNLGSIITQLASYVLTQHIVYTTNTEFKGFLQKWDR